MAKYVGMPGEVSRHVYPHPVKRGRTPKTPSPHPQPNHQPDPSPTEAAPMRSAAATLFTRKLPLHKLQPLSQSSEAAWVTYGYFRRLTITWRRHSNGKVCRQPVRAMRMRRAVYVPASG